MKKRFAIITDIHGNIEGLNAILKDIENKKIDEIICLGDTIDIGPNSKECIDKLIDNNIKMTLGNHELYLLRGTSIDPSINNVEEIEHYKWVKNQLSEKEINIIEAHMFPISIKVLPKYKESIIVSLMDKVAWLYEKVSGYSKEINYNLGKTLIYVFLYVNS